MKLCNNAKLLLIKNYKIRGSGKKNNVNIAQNENLYRFFSITSERKKPEKHILKGKQLGGHRHSEKKTS